MVGLLPKKQHGALVEALEADARRVGSVRAWAKREGFSPQYVSAVVAGRKAPSARFLAALGLELEVEVRLVPLGVV